MVVMGMGHNQLGKYLIIERNGCRNVVRKNVFDRREKLFHSTVDKKQIAVRRPNKTTESVGDIEEDHPKACHSRFLRNVDIDARIITGTALATGDDLQRGHRFLG